MGRHDDVARCAARSDVARRAQGTAPFGRAVPGLSRRADRPRPLLPRSRPPTPWTSCAGTPRSTASSSSTWAGARATSPRPSSAAGARCVLVEPEAERPADDDPPGHAVGHRTVPPRRRRRPRPARRERHRRAVAPGRLAPGRTVAGDGNRLPFADGVADVAFSSNVLEHVPDPARFLDEMVRVTRPGGIIYLSFTAWYSPWGGHETAPWHYLGGHRAARRYERRHGRPPGNRFGSSLFACHVGPTLRMARAHPGVDVVDALPRYYPDWMRWLIEVPALREVATWNLLLVLRRRGPRREPRGRADDARRPPVAGVDDARPTDARRRRRARRRRAVAAARPASPTPDAGGGLAGRHHARRVRHPARHRARTPQPRARAATPTTSTTPPTCSSRGTASSTPGTTRLHPHQIIQTADWPPLFVFVLAMTSVVGFKSFFAHRVWCCVIGAAAVTVCGITGREIARAPGRAHRRLLGGGVPQHLDERRARPVRDADPAARRPRPAGAPTASGSSPGSRRMLVLGAVDGRGHPGTRRVGAAGAARRDPPGARGSQCALARPPGPGRARDPGRAHRRGSLGRLQHEPVREAHLHQLRARHHAGLGQLRPDMVGALRGVLVAARARSRPRSTSTPTSRCSRPRRRPTRCTSSAPTSTASVRVELARLGRAFGAFHPLAADRARLLRGDAPVSLGARRARACTTRSWRSGARWHRGAAPATRAGVPACGHWASTWWPPCSSASARPGTGPPSRCPWCSWPPCSSTPIWGRLRHRPAPDDVARRAPVDTPRPGAAPAPCAPAG